MTEEKSARLETTSQQPMALLGIKLRGDLRGLIFETCVAQRFRNPMDQHAEVVYTFPLPARAVLLGVDVWLGERHLTGAVVEKKQAEATYEEALAQANTAILLEKNADHSYSLNLGNLAAQQSCTVRLRYAEILQFEQQGLRLLIPTVIAPRFGDAVRHGGLLPSQAPEHSLMAEYPFDLEICLHGDLAFASAASPSHLIKLMQKADGLDRALKVSLAGQAALDRDFILVIDQLVHNSTAMAAPDCVEAGSMVALVSFCPRIATQKKLATALKILVDCSSSMAGDSLMAAQQALLAIVGQLDSQDRFSLSRFGSTVLHRPQGLCSTTKATRLAAQRWVEGLEADLGGTEMAAALTSTFVQTGGVDCDVLLITDGEISAIDSTIQSATSSGHRVFVVGIGSSPAEVHLRRIAAATGGACDFVAPGEAVGPAVLRMFTRLRSPRLIEPQVVWPADTKPLWVSPQLPSVFDGDTVHAWAWLTRPPQGEVRLIARTSAATPPQEIGRVSLDVTHAVGDTLCRVAASVRTELEMAANAPEHAPAQAVQRAVAYQLVTRQTSFVLIHDLAPTEKPADMPALHKVPQMLPAGWGGMGTAKRRDRNFFETRVTEYKPANALDWDEAPAPPVRRYHSARTAPAPSPLSSPLGMSIWLRAAPMSTWPKSYLELSQTGLIVPQNLADWLRGPATKMGKGSRPEALVITTFLYVLSLQEVHDFLHLNLPVPPYHRGNAFGKHSIRSTPPEVDPELMVFMMRLLPKMTAHKWPVIRSWASFLGIGV